MSKLSALVGEEHSAEFKALWEEYEANETAEATMAHDLDKFDMIHQVSTRENAFMSKICIYS